MEVMNCTELIMRLVAGRKGERGGGGEGGEGVEMGRVAPWDRRYKLINCS